MTNQTDTINQWSNHLRQCGWEQVLASQAAAALKNSNNLPPALDEICEWQTADEGGASILLIRISGTALPPPKQLFARYLDCPLEARQILWRIPPDACTDFCLFCDDIHQYWYNASKDVCLGGRLIDSDLADQVWPFLTLDNAYDGELQNIPQIPFQQSKTFQHKQLLDQSISFS